MVPNTCFLVIVPVPDVVSPASLAASSIKVLLFLAGVPLEPPAQLMALLALILVLMCIFHLEPH